MKNRYIYLFIISAILLLTGCDDDIGGRVVFPDSTPEISNLSYSFTDYAEAAGSISFSLDIEDPITPLSTMDVSLIFNDEVIYSDAVRTEGNSAQIKEYEIFIPFHSVFEEGAAKLVISAINVEGVDKTEVKEFTLKRPDLPATLYLHYDDAVVPMTRDEHNPFEYQTEESSFPESFSGKISTAQTLEESNLIWGHSETPNMADIGSATGAEFTFRFENSTIDRVTFNTFSFNLGFVGISKIISINGIELTLNTDNLYQGTVKFEENAEVEVTGIQDLEGAYNRDFFSYDGGSDKLTYLRETGTWTVYYSMKYNYMWIARMGEEAPDTYWLVGHGFTCASEWHDDYHYGGWNLEDITRLGYLLKIGDHKYQATLYLSDDHEWDSFEVEIYSDLEWGKDKGMLLSSDDVIKGDNVGFTISDSNGFTNTDGFTSGYFRLTFDNSAGVGGETMTIERIGN